MLSIFLNIFFLIYVEVSYFFMSINKIRQQANLHHYSFSWYFWCHQTYKMMAMYKRLSASVFDVIEYSASSHTYIYINCRKSSFFSLFEYQVNEYPACDVVLAFHLFGAAITAAWCQIHITSISADIFLICYL